MDSVPVHRKYQNKMKVYWIFTIAYILNRCFIIDALGASSIHTISVQDGLSQVISNPTFVKETWQKKAIVTKSNYEGHFTMEDFKNCLDEQIIVAGRGTFQEGRGGWNMARVGSTKSGGSSLKDMKLSVEDMDKALEQKSGTVVVNSAGAYMPSLAKVCEECLNVFGLPVNMNLYLTANGQETSAPPHTDKQDVFVIQTEGKKHWRVYEPPELTKTHPMERGKSKDCLDMNELKDPILDVILEQGSLLYIPAGWPHTTDTIIDDDNKDHSVHMTIGVDTHIWSLTYASMRQYCLAKSGKTDELDPLHLKTKSNHYWRLQDTLPFGFLADSEGYGFDKERMCDDIVINLIQRMKDAEPHLYKDQSFDQLRQELHVDEVMEKLMLHQSKMVNVFGHLYADVAYELEETELNVGYLRSRPYYNAIEATMEDLVQWGKPLSSAKIEKKVGFGSTSTKKKKKKK